MNFKDVPAQSQLTLDQQPGRRRKPITARLMFKVVNNMAPPRFSSMFQNCDRIYIHCYKFRGSNLSLFLPHPNTECGRRCFCYTVGLKSGIT